MICRFILFALICTILVFHIESFLSIKRPTLIPQRYQTREIYSSDERDGEILDVGGSSKRFGFDTIGVNSKGWQEVKGNFVLRPATKPIGVVHFLGGAFFGAAPHLLYRYMLEALCDAGYIVVSTPYRLQLDYVLSCDAILSKFDAVAADLAREYGALPVIGIGHSCGALLQTLITSLFPGAPRALNVLISFNNKPIEKAIPGYQEVIIPLAEVLMANTSRASDLREQIASVRSTVDGLMESSSKTPFIPPFVSKELVPLYWQSVEFFDQVPPLLRSLASGQRDFNPSAVDTKEACRRMYRARKTLLLRFENDALDESLEIEKVLREANTIMRMRRPMVEMEVELKTLTGNHMTPLTQDLLALLETPAGLVPEPLKFLDVSRTLRQQARQNMLLTIDSVTQEILQFLESSISGVPSPSSPSLLDPR